MTTNEIDIFSAKVLFTQSGTGDILYKDNALPI